MISSRSSLYGTSRTYVPSGAWLPRCFGCHNSDATHRAATGENLSFAQVISDLLYQRKIAESLCPLVGDRRLISEEGLSAIEKVLRQRFEAKDKGGE